ncbi:MAG TPA: ABC transporter substrate-binding protein [Herpetosiphonaceae bacterium]
MRSTARRILDLLALLVLVAYGWTAHYTQRGAADPIWTAIQQRGVLRVGTDPGFRPFAEERDGRFQGYDIDLVRELARRIGVRVEFVAVGYDALYDALSTRRVDLLAAALPLAPEQGWRARFSTPYLNAGQAIVARKGAGITKAADLDGRVVGAALGSEGDTLARKLQRDLPAMTVDSSFDSPAAALDTLAAGRIDAVLTDTISALSAAPAHPGLGIAHVLTFEPYVLAMPVEAYQLEQAINRALEEMRREQVFDRLNAQWFRPEFVR